MRSRFTIVFAVLFASMAFWALARLRSEQPSHARSEAPRTVERAPAVVIQAPMAGKPEPFGSTASDRDGLREYLRGLPEDFKMTDVDGGLPTDAEGNFVASQTALRAFNYFLSASGAEPQEQTLDRIRAYIRAQLDPPAEQQALDFLDQFLSYRDAGLALRDEIQRNGLSVEQQAESLSELRIDFFGEELAQELFAREEALREHHIRVRRILDDPSLQEGERQALIEAAEQTLPEELRAYREQSRKSSQQRAIVAEMRASGTSEREIFDHRAQSFGEDAARRFAALDAQRAELDREVERYLAYAVEIGDRTPEQQSELLSSYLAEELTAQQARRIKGLAELARQGKQAE